MALAPYAGHWRYELARTYLLVGRTDEARRELKVWVRLNPSLNRVQGRSMNASQNHIGQMLDDFVLDADMLHDVRAALALPLAEQPQALLDLVRLEPDATAPALLYIIACIRLRIQAHRKAAPGPVGPEARPDQLIPKKIIQFWDADPPQEVLALMALWGERNPDYAYERFDDRSAAALIAQHHGREVSEAFRRSVHPAQRADLFRLAYLSVCGGIYVDADDMCLTPLDLYIPQASKLFAYQEDMGTLANNFLGAAPGHPVIQRALKCGVEAVNRGDSDMIWLLTGPGLVTRAFAQIAAEGHMDMTKSCRIRAFSATTWSPGARAIRARVFVRQPGFKPKSARPCG